MPFPSISMPYPSSSQVPALSAPLETSASSINSDVESPKTSTTKRSPSWSTLEEVTLIRIYKEEVEGLRKKGKKGQTMWAIIAEKLEKEMKALEVNSSRTPQRVKEKFFNLTRRYKQAKDKIKSSGAGSDDMETCPHFEILDEFMGSRDIVNPPYLVETTSKSTSESTRSTPSPAPSTSSASEELEGNAASGENPRKAKKHPCEDINKVDCEDGSGYGKKGGKATKKRKRPSKGSGQSDDDPWLAIFRESQEREERMMAALERSENNFKDLFLTAITEFGKMVKKD